MTLTRVPGLRVGHWTDPAARTGCTVVLCDPPAVGGVDVRGGAPGTRETDLLAPGRLVERVDAVLLAGGSAFGLAAADGVVGWLEAQGRGFDTGVARVPIVPAAVLFDLGVGRADVRPDAASGRAACRNASDDPVPEGAVGAGAGATVGHIGGPEAVAPGGVGSASTIVDGATVGALAAVNALGSVHDPRTGRRLAGGPADRAAAAPLAGGHTTLVVAATDAALTKAGCRALAVSAHDGLARAVRPAHTRYDGDIVFALSCGPRQADPVALGVAVAEVVGAAIARAVRAGTDG